jgi:hypothetical protein
LAKKKSEEPKIRDQCVRTVAEDLKRDNWLVKANAQGWEKPSEIGGVIPDVLAHKGCLKRICQIVTKKDFEGNTAKYRDFKNFCKEYDFQMYIIGKKGRLDPIDPQDLTKK